MLEVQKDHDMLVLQVVIVDMATGTESYGTRWTAEAPAVEALMRMVVGGSEPLAFFNSIPTLATMYGSVFGITGTLGQQPCLDYYAHVYKCWDVLRIPRNLRSYIYQLEPQIAKNEDDWLKNIRSAAEKYLGGQLGLGVTGPVLIVVESIQKAKKLVEIFTAAGHVEMEQDDEKWKPKTIKTGVQRASEPPKKLAHLFPLCRGFHGVMRKLPDASIVIGTNKAGRGLDLKVDGKCPDGCTLHSAKSEEELEKSVPRFLLMF